jgi:uncharacterized membrane protein YgdD (TMEM256/DUF423 family)
MERLFLSIGAISGFVSVGLGAFGAHALKRRLSADLLEIFHTGAQYQMYHALALVAVGLFAARAPSPVLNLAGWLFVAGTILFSGSLYALSLSGVRPLGAITPLGGLCFLAGWALFTWAALRAN